MPEQFDVSKYELEDTSTLIVKNARLDDVLIGADGVNPIEIELYSPGSPQGVKALHKSGRASQLRLFRTMRGEFSQRDAEDADRESIEKLAGFTKSIKNFPLSSEALYGNPRLIYIAKQVEEHISKFGNFSKGSSPS